MQTRHGAHWVIICLAGSVLLSVILAGSRFAAPASAAGGAPLPTPVPLPGSGSRTYPATGQTVTGLFLDYWDAHGGLAQQGYPISPVMGEASDLDGKPYTVQYFERAVFEYHPENAGSPYEVLLSQLGTVRYHQKYPNGAPDQRPNTTRDSVYFAQTGHRLGGAFLAYWQQHGGLAQQGYPLSDEFTEISDLNGQPYTVQYFERAVFEYHPENQAPYDVLLSQLGTFQYNARYRSPVPSPTPSSIPESGGSPQLIATQVNGPVVAGGPDLFWIAGNGQDSIVAAYNTDTHQPFTVRTLTGVTYGIYGLASDGATLVWLETPPSQPASVQGYDLATQRQFQVMQAPSANSELGGLAIADGVLYYQDGTAGHIGLFARNLASGQEHLVSADGRNPVAEDGVLLWSEEAVTGTRQPPYAPVTCSIHMRLLRNGGSGDTQIASVDGPAPGDCGFSGYHVSGDHLIWAPDPPADPHVYLYTISTSATQTLSPSQASNPLIHGTVALWTTEPQDNHAGWTIDAYQLATGARATIVPLTSRQIQTWTMLDPLSVVYTQSGNLYLARFTIP